MTERGNRPILKEGDEYVCTVCGHRSTVYKGFWEDFEGDVWVELDSPGEKPDDEIRETFNRFTEEGIKVVHRRLESASGFEYTCTKGDDITCRACQNEFHMDCSLFVLHCPKCEEVIDQKVGCACWEGTPPTIWLDDDESVGIEDGLVLVRNHRATGNPAVFKVPLHRKAEGVE